MIPSDPQCGMKAASGSQKQSELHGASKLTLSNLQVESSNMRIVPPSQINKLHFGEC